MGDELLRLMTARMKQAAHAGCDLYRVGGDEPASLVATDDARAAMTLATLFVAAAATTLAAHGARLSAGIAIRRVGEDPLEALARADRALHSAKRNGGGVRLG